MKILRMLLILTFVGGLSVAMGCGDNDSGMENAGEGVNNAADETGDAMHNAAEETGDAAKKAGDKMKDAAKDATN